MSSTEMIRGCWHSEDCVYFLPHNWKHKRYIEDLNKQLEQDLIIIRSLVKDLNEEEIKEGLNEMKDIPNEEAPKGDCCTECNQNINFNRWCGVCRSLVNEIFWIPDNF